MSGIHEGGDPWYPEALPHDHKKLGSLDINIRDLCVYTYSNWTVPNLRVLRLRGEDSAYVNPYMLLEVFQDLFPQLDEFRPPLVWTTGKMR